MSTATTAFFQHFDRHAHGKGLKGASTHYCPGCGHGLVHKYLAETIAAYEIQDRTIAISPVGCAVFLYYYFDVGNTQAAHGRAPAVALGHKLANPDSVVISYQGDGDLASIGLAEIVHAAQLGVPLTVVFVNNAIYGMTGGQMAPTTLPGQISTTTPKGRGLMEGEPIRMAEMIAGLNGAIYVERTGLFNQKNRKRTRRAIEKGIRLQMEGRGFSFIEVLAECPTHLKKTPMEAEKWVETEMTKYFPLGVKKDEEREPWFDRKPVEFDPEKVLSVIGAEAKHEEHAKGKFPEQIDPVDVSAKFAGAGGDGAQTGALVLARTAINEGFDATHIPSYGPESRGGTSYADVHIAQEEVLSPASPNPHLLVAFNAPSLQKFGPTVRENGIIIYDSSVIRDVPEVKEGVRIVPVPASEIAQRLGRIVVKNVAALGALCEAAKIFSEESFFEIIRTSLKNDCSMIQLNESAFHWGGKAVREKIETFRQ